MFTPGAVNCYINSKMGEANQLAETWRLSRCLKASLAASKSGAPIGQFVSLRDLLVAARQKFSQIHVLFVRSHKNGVNVKEARS